MEKFIKGLNVYKEFSKWLLSSRLKKKRFYHISETLKTLLISTADLSSFKNTIIVTFSPAEAEILYQELDTMHNSDIDIIYIPDLNLKDEDNLEEQLNEARVIFELSKFAEDYSGNRIIITSVDSFIMPVIPKKVISRKTLTLKLGDEIPMDDLEMQLTILGYRREKRVSDLGDFSVRGGIIDVFGNGFENPFRIEYFGDNIESLREFDISEGRSIKEHKSIKIYPNNFRELVSTTSKESNIRYKDYYLFSYFSPKDTLFIIDEEDRINKRIDFLRKEFSMGGLLGHIERIEFEFEKFISRFKTVFFTEHFLTRPDAVDVGAIQIGYFARYFSIFFRSLKEWLEEGFTIFIFVNNSWRQEHLENMIKRYEEAYKFPSKILIRIGLFRKGFLLQKEKLVVVTEADIWGGYRLRKEKRPKGSDELDLNSIRYGEFVVHEEYGIGKYKGIEKKDIDGVNSDYFIIEYQYDENLFVPLDRIGLIQKYISIGNYRPKLHSIRSKRWQNEKTQAVKSIETMVKDLLELYAQRALKKGFKFSEDDSMQEEFDMEFTFDETEDQLNAIKEVKMDMESETPMDRLICGDVGFGKTEIAIRAAFKSVKDNKQVALLAPTTILCEQHYFTFLDRFKNQAVNIGMLSRFVTKKEQTEVVKKLNEGKVDIVIGTHRLLSKDIEFKDLGLLIIDEEQRFGVKQKEKLRLLKKNVDTLTLTATPIPRTLYFSLLKLRPISMIETPPENRLPVKTVITTFKRDLIKEAILREMKRGGQIFFVHNRVEELPEVEAMLTNLVPEARMITAHGQMLPKELERKVRDFVNGAFDILLCTTIIEIGVDMPNVNTLFINQAENFGLSQLYQLKGRVGRSFHQAYAYFIIANPYKLKTKALQRLDAIETYSELGSGYHIAFQDLQIRGTGNILSTNQHGHIDKIGLGLYMRLLKNTINLLKGKEQDKKETEVNKDLVDLSLKVNAFIPENFTVSDNDKQEIYRLISKTKSMNEVDYSRERVIDKFGKLPQSIEQLFLIEKIRILSSIKMINKIAEGKREIFIRFPEEFDFEVKKEHLENLLSELEGDWIYDPDKNLLSFRKPVDNLDKLNLITNILQGL